MGTNYYLRERVCSLCGRSDEKKHIGKSSAGWCFALKIYPEEGINDLADWVNYILERKETAIIENEYGERVTIEFLAAEITSRYWANGGHSDEWLKKNHAVEGPFGLARHKPQKEISPGAGTYDLISLDFS